MTESSVKLPKDDGVTPDFVESVTQTIHSRSGGRFFSKRTPWIAIVFFLAVLGIGGYLLWQRQNVETSTGSEPVTLPIEVPH